MEPKMGGDWAHLELKELLEEAKALNLADVSGSTKAL